MTINSEGFLPPQLDQLPIIPVPDCPAFTATPARMIEHAVYLRYLAGFRRTMRVLATNGESLEAFKQWIEKNDYTTKIGKTTPDLTRDVFRLMFDDGDVSVEAETKQCINSDRRSFPSHLPNLTETRPELTKSLRTRYSRGISHVFFGDAYFTTYPTPQELVKTRLPDDDESSLLIRPAGIIYYPFVQHSANLKYDLSGTMYHYNFLTVSYFEPLKSAPHIDCKLHRGYIKDWDEASKVYLEIDHLNTDQGTADSLKRLRDALRHPITTAYGMGKRW